jgi:hypothetical protein
VTYPGSPTVGGSGNTWGTQLNACLTWLQANSSSSTPGDVQPADVGAVAWTADPARSIGVNSWYAGSYAGILLLWMFRSGAGGSVSNIYYNVYGAGAGLSNCYLGIYSMAGSLLAQCTTDQSTNMVSVAPHTAALSGAYTLASGTLYRIGLVIGAMSTSPSLMGAGSQESYTFTNLAASSAANYPSASYGSLNTYTALPSSFTPASLGTLAGKPIFVLR